MKRKPERKIRFTFEDKNYETDLSAYNVNNIKLPDGRVLSPDMWLKSYPPIPRFLSITKQRIDKAVEAKEVTPDASDNS